MATTARFWVIKVESFIFPLVIFYRVLFKSSSESRKEEFKAINKVLSQEQKVDTMLTRRRSKCDEKWLLIKIILNFLSCCAWMNDECLFNHHGSFFLISWNFFIYVLRTKGLFFCARWVDFFLMRFSLKIFLMSPQNIFAAVCCFFNNLHFLLMFSFN